MISSPTRNILFNHPILLIPHLTISWISPGGLLKGQTLMQFAQSVPLFAQKGRQVSALVCHACTPSLLEILWAFELGSPSIRDWLGHCWAHFLQIIQKSHTPNSMGLSGTTGRSVKILANLIRGPYWGVMSSPFRPSSPSPASMAMGILQAVSLPQGSQRERGEDHDRRNCKRRETRTANGG